MALIKRMASRTPLNHSVILSLSLCLAFLIGSAVPAWSATIVFKCALCIQTGYVNELTGGNYEGEDIVIDTMFVTGAHDPNDDGFYDVKGGLLTFDTSPGPGNDNFIRVEGAVTIGTHTIKGTLLDGSISSFTFTVNVADQFIFNGTGPDDKNEGLLKVLGLADTDWTYAATQLGGEWTGSSGIPDATAAITNKAVVPLPTSLLLFGTGLIGLVGISRRQVFGGFFKG